MDTDLIGLGESIIGSINTNDALDPLSLNATYYSDDYFLIPPENGSSITISITSNQFDTYLEVVDAIDGLLLDFNDDRVEGDSNSQLEMDFLGGGRYIIRVTSFDEYETGAYTLSVN